MDVVVQLFSCHPVLIHALRKMSFHAEGFSFQTLPPTLIEPPTPNHVDALCFFLLDACSLHTNVGPLMARCRNNCPGSKFIALLPPSISFAEKIRLFCWGMDGFVELHETWQAELPLAVNSILHGQLWVPREVMETFMKRERTLFETRLVPGHSLTARERQVLQLLMRGLANKEISSSLEISERTVKFHVSNILIKLQLEDRRELFSDKAANKANQQTTCFSS
jgi:DNA-binding CsgD family transcriptional regulator